MTGDHNVRTDFGTNFVGAVKFGRQSGQWDVAIGFHMSSLSGNDYSPYVKGDSGEEVLTPYGGNGDEDNVNMSGRDSAQLFSGDLEVGYRPSGIASGNANVRVFGGLRIASTKFDRYADFLISTSSNSWKGTESSRFYGIGPRVGASFETPIGSAGSAGVNLFGSASGGVMFGQITHSMNGQKGGSSGSSYHSSYSNSASVPFADVEFGVGLAVAKDQKIEFGVNAGIQKDVIKTFQICSDRDEHGLLGGSSYCGDTARSSLISRGAFIRYSWKF